LGQLGISWSHKENLSVVAELSDNCVSGSFLDAGDSAFSSAARLAESDLDSDLVATHRGPDQSGRYIDVAFNALNLLFRHDKPISVPMNEYGRFVLIPRPACVPVAARVV